MSTEGKDEQAGEYTITVEGPGLTLERRVPSQIGEQVVVLILSGGAMKGATRPLGGRPNIGTSSPTPVQPGENEMDDDSPPLSLAEFLRAAEPKRNPDKITTIAKFLRDHRSKEEFTRDDIVSGFQEAAESAPGNMTRDMKWAIKNGWIAQVPGKKGRYYVTNNGMTAVTKKFPTDLLKKTQVPGSRKNSTNSSPSTTE